MSVSLFPTTPLTGPCCPLSGLPWEERSRRRDRAIATLGLGDPRSIPAWDEATQMVARFLAVPMVVVTLASRESESFRAAYGLSHLGLGNPLSQQRQLPLSAGLGVYVLDSEQPIVLTDTTDNPVVAQSELVATYAIRAYCGVPLVTSQGHCIGTLAAMDTQPRPFDDQALGFLAMAARWGMSEYERQLESSTPLSAPLAITPSLDSGAMVDAVRLNLISQLTQDLRSPLTTVLGMATMLSREIYGPLTQKQREYTDIVCRSSQTLMTLVDELIDLGQAEAPHPELVPTPLDIEILGQQVLNTLSPLAEKCALSLTLSVEPGENYWILDQRTVKQILYHLVFSVMQVAGDNGTLRIHACRRDQALVLVLWLSNPWLGEGLPTEVIDLFQGANPRGSADCPGLPLSSSALPKDLLGLVLSQQLAQCHGGRITVQGSADSGCRLLIVLPTLDSAKARSEAQSEAQSATRPGRVVPSLTR